MMPVGITAESALGYGLLMAGYGIFLGGLVMVLAQVGRVTLTEVGQSYGGLALLRRIDHAIFYGAFTRFYPAGQRSYEWISYAKGDRRRIDRIHTDPYLTIIETTDGVRTWCKQGHRVEMVDGNHLDSVFWQAGLDCISRLLEAEAAGCRVTYCGREVVSGEPFEVLELRGRKGPPIRYFISPDTHLVERINRPVGGGKTMQEVRLAEYRSQYGLPVPHHIQTRINGALQGELTLQRIDFEASLPVSLFDCLAEGDYPLPHFVPPGRQDRPRLWFDNETELKAFRHRLNYQPWKSWHEAIKGPSRNVYYASRLAALLPLPHNWPTTTLSLATLMAGLTFLVVTNWRRNKKQTAALQLLLGTPLVLLFSAASVARTVLYHDPQAHRSATALLVLRYLITGRKAYALRVKELLAVLGKVRWRYQTSTDRAAACQIYTMAYDAVWDWLNSRERARISQTLFDLAGPLYDLLESGTQSGSKATIAAAGLGLVGITIGYEPYLDRALQEARKTVEKDLQDGLYVESIGVGGVVFNQLSNFLYVLKRKHGIDLFQEPGFMAYIEQVTRLLAPAATPPFFGNTNLKEGGLDLIQMLMKVSSHVPAQLGQRCRWLWARFQETGRFVEAKEPRSFRFDPYSLLLCTKDLKERAIPGQSFVSPAGNAAVLRSSADADTLYLALVNPSFEGANHRHRDANSFDLWAYGAWFVHGAGYPGWERPGFPYALSSLAANTILINGQGQQRFQSDGIVESLLSNETVDYLRSVADRCYVEGGFTRHILFIRPQLASDGYYVLLDQVNTLDPSHRVDWLLHSRGELVVGERMALWAVRTYPTPRSMGETVRFYMHMAAPDVVLNRDEGEFYPEETRSRCRSAPKSTYVRAQYAGPTAFLVLLYPLRGGQSVPEVRHLEDCAGMLVNGQDLILSSPSGEVIERRGWMTDAELAFIRQAGVSQDTYGFMQGGKQFAATDGRYGIQTNAPITIQFSLLSGILQTRQADTQVRLVSPLIEGASVLEINQKRQSISQRNEAVSFSLPEPGQYRFSLY